MHVYCRFLRLIAAPAVAHSRCGPTHALALTEPAGCAKLRFNLLSPRCLSSTADIERGCDRQKTNLALDNCMSANNVADIGKSSNSTYLS
eukprot:6192174-Pleurochrysis_carterae.AAC.3